MQFHDIFIVQHVIAFDGLAVINSGPPNPGGFETGREVEVD